MTETYPDYSKPYPEVVGVAISHFHPETLNDRDLEELREQAREDPPSEWMSDVKAQFVQALERHLDGMDLEEFDRVAQPSAKTHEIFIRRMWATIFPDEPIPGAPSGPFDAIYTIIDIHFGDIDPEGNLVHPDHLARQLQRPESEQSALLRAIRSDLTRMLQGDFEGLHLREFRTHASAYYFGMRKDDKDFARHVWRYLFPDEPLPEAP